MRLAARPLFLPLASLFLFTGTAFAQPMAPAADRIQVFNQELNRLSTLAPETTVNRVRQLIGQRLEAFRELAESDPAGALSLLLPGASLGRLRGFAADIAAGLETEGEWSGQAEVVVEDDFEHHTSRTHVSLESNGEWLEVFGDTGTPQLRSGATIRGTGVRMGSMILTRGLAIVAAGGTGGCSSIGVQKLAVIMVNFASSSIDTSTVNATSLGAIINGAGHSTTKFWNEASYGQTSAIGDVYGPFNLTVDYTNSNYTGLQAAAINAAATSGGVNFSNYNHVVIVMPNGFPVGGGLGTIGCVALSSPTTGAFQAGVVWVRADFTVPNDVGVCGFVHENGHNMGLNHASTESYGTVPLGSFGTVPVHTEYGSYFSLMSQCWSFGSTTLLGHYDAQHKSQLGWFVPSNTQTVTANGSFVLAPTETATTNLQAIRVQRGAGNNFWLWLEYRQQVGYDATFAHNNLYVALSGQIYSGAMIHFEDPTNTTYTGYTRLLNFTAPGSPDFSQPALAVGSSWSDPYSLLTLSVTSADSAGLHVTVNYDTPCATFTPAAKTYGSSGAVSDSVAVTAPGGCSWTGVSNANWITVNTGATGSGSGAVTYSLSANPTVSPRTGTITIARQSFTITQASSNPQPTPVSVSPDNNSSAPGSSQTFTFTYSDAAGASALAEVSALFSSSTSNVSACNVGWVKSGNTIRVYNDAADGYSWWYANANSNASNSQCSVSWTNTSVVTSGNSLTFTLTITFTNAFAGLKNIYMEAQDTLTADSGLNLLGTWSVGSTVPITISTSPAGLSIVVDSVTYTAPQTFHWVAGSGHTIFANSPQAGFAWSVWSDGGLLSHTIVTPSTATNYTATFTSAAALRFVPITPCRVVDTRNATGAFGGPSIAANTSRAFAMPSGSCGIPSNAQAYSFNVTVVPPGQIGYLVLWPTGQAQPLASTLNSDGRAKANAAIIPAGTGGSISAYSSNTTDLILDINGYFVSATDTTALAFYPITPCRIADTRNATGPLGGPSISANQTRTFPIQTACNIPSTAKAYSLNLTAVPQGVLWVLAAWPTGLAQPFASTLNDPTATVVANAAILPAGTNGSIDVYASSGTDLVIDINGYFAPMAPGGLSLYNVTPCRVLDTRFSGSQQPITTLDVAVSASACGIPAAAQAHVFNATVVPPAAMSYLAMWPQGQSIPLVSTLNAQDAAVTANMAIVPTTNGSISLFASSPTHVVLDVSGYFAQ